VRIDEYLFLTRSISYWLTPEACAKLQENGRSIEEERMWAKYERSLVEDEVTAIEGSLVDLQRHHAALKVLLPVYLSLSFSLTGYITLSPMLSPFTASLVHSLSLSFLNHSLRFSLPPSLPLSLPLPLPVSPPPSLSISACKNFIDPKKLLDLVPSRSY
jgi:hypothetical protein